MSDEIHSTEEDNHRHHCSRMKKIRYIGVDFDDSKIGKCENEVNKALSQGFQPLERIDTPRGVIMVMGLYENLED